MNGTSKKKRVVRGVLRGGADCGRVCNKQIKFVETATTGKVNAWQPPGRPPRLPAAPGQTISLWLTRS
jgi:hypothetical protein